MIALAVSAPNSKADNNQAGEASPFAQLTGVQRICVIDIVKTDPSILVSIYKNIYVIRQFLNMPHFPEIESDNWSLALS